MLPRLFYQECSVASSLNVHYLGNRSHCTSLAVSCATTQWNPSSVLNCNGRELYCKFVWYETSSFSFFPDLELGRVTVLSTRCSFKPSVLILEADPGKLCCKTSLRARVSKERVFSPSSSCCLQNISTAPIYNYPTGMWSTWGMRERLLKRGRVSGSPRAKEKSALP